MASKHRCPYCNRDDFASSKGLQQHQQRNQFCHKQILHSLQLPSATSRIAHDYMQMTTISKQKAVNSAFPFTSWSATNTTTNADTSKNKSARSNNKHTIEEVNESEEDYVAVLDDDEDSFGSHFNEAAGAAAAANQEESEVLEDEPRVIHSRNTC